jgi:hypothetical protein
MDFLKKYINDIFQVASRGDAREESYYSSLEELLREYANISGRKHIQITTLPKKTEAGNPDFRIWDGVQNIVGYIEAKNPQTENLDLIETTEQLQRYLNTFPNLILTNFLEFRLYRNGTLIDKVSIARPFLMLRLDVVPPIENREEFLSLLEKFFSFSLPEVRDSRALALELAKRTRFLKDIVLQQLKEEIKEEKGDLYGFFSAFRDYLLKGIAPEEFADLYSQTVTYGLFAARTRATNSFNRKLAYDFIPRTIGILRDLFRFISLGDLPPQMEWIIDDIANVLAVTDVDNILHQYFHEGKGDDPIVHFYETFLAQYDPETRERRGVYYTPEPVVSYIVRSIEKILAQEFRMIDGFASGQVTVLDPAAGTLSFLAYATKRAFERVYGLGKLPLIKLIRDHILKNFYAFEIMMAPYAIGHLKMSLLFEEYGYKLQPEERFKFYLTNSLEMEELAQTSIPGLSSLSEESHLAGMVKKELPILVIMGNPPYSGQSQNVGEWIMKEIRAYYQVDGQPLKERNPKWLQDDYVKFIRFAQWKLDQESRGILGFITNHTYLDNPTFRGMRQSLLESFDEIYILNLHGNSLRKEKAPDGSPDENVFDIRMGVAISFMIKKKSKEPPKKPKSDLFNPNPPPPPKELAKVYYAEIWGKRESKYEYLLKNDITTTQWVEVKPKSPFYFFIPRKEEFAELYNKFIKITEIFPVHSVGIKTARDHLTIRFTADEVWSVVVSFSKMDPELARMTYKLGKDAREWKVELAQKDLKESKLDKKKIVPILYRPFDVRYTYYTGKSRGFHCRPRPEVMRHMLKRNWGLVTIRRPASPKKWEYAFITNTMISGGAISSTDIGYLFPLYVYEKKQEKKNPFGTMMMFFEKKEEEYEIPRPNINPKLLEKLEMAYGEAPFEGDILLYIYAILYSDVYRTKYDEFLRADFPAIPFTKNKEKFKKMRDLGERLAKLHLLMGPELDVRDLRLMGDDDRVREVRYDEENERVYINEKSYFERVKKEVWEYEIGTYQICRKWLEDRKGRSLSYNDISTYFRMISAIEKTMEIQKEIDELYPQIEEELLEFEEEGEE